MIPAHLADEVASEAVEMTVFEDYVQEQVMGGRSVLGLYPPTDADVAASFAALGDVILAEPRAIIGFAGARVIEQTVRQKLPDGFQRAEFLLEKGAIDLIVDRRQMRDKLHQLLALLLGKPADLGS